MKLIIIEGPDRVGKDTLVKALVEWSDSTIVRHWSFPKGSTNQERIAYQKYSFKKEFDLYTTLSQDTYFSGGSHDTMIWNRSHLGEFVYGQLYREYDASWIFNLEALYGFDQDDKILLILLHADADFLCARDDGKSFAANLEQKQIEIQLFDQAFERSIIKNKIKIKVNQANEYRDSRKIFEEVLEYIEPRPQISRVDSKN